MRSIFVILGYTRGLNRLYFVITLCAVLVSLTGVAVPFVLAEATNLMVKAVGGASVGVGPAVVLATLLLAFDLANIFFRNIGGYVGDIMAARLKNQLSTIYYKHLLALPQSYFDGELTGVIINRLNRAIVELTTFLNQFANNFFPMLLTIIVTIIIVATHSWFLATLTIVMYPLFMWLTALTSRKWQIFQRRKNLETDIASGRFAEVVSQMKVVKSYTHEKIEHLIFSKHFKNTVDITKKQSSYWHKMDVARGSVLSLIFFLIFAYIFVMTIEGVFQISEMILLITLINGLRAPLFNMSFIVDNFQKAVTGSRDMLDALQIDPAIADSDNSIVLPGVKGEVSLENISFTYKRDGRRALRGVSFSLSPGERVALVGESGGGKTTIANILMRLYEPDGGRVLIDGHDITKVKQGSLRQNIATVFQDPSLFSGTIRENIAYGKPNASLDEIKKAAADANADKFIEMFDEGYETEIGERGLKLSGGQKQRIAIARAILKDAPILILDEATSSLDSRSEQQVQKALDRLMKSRTTLVIAHRLSTIASVDKIVTLRNGKVDEIGTPDELEKTNGLYATLLELQQAGGKRNDERLAKYDISAND